MRPWCAHGVPKEEPIPRLNLTLVRSLEPPANGDKIIMDSDLPGFGVRVTSGGAKTFFVRYRVMGGRDAQQRRFKIGAHPVMTPEVARKAAKQVLAEAQLGRDPAFALSASRNSITVKQLIEEWADGPGQRTRKGRPKSAYAFKQDKARLRNHVVPIIGRVKLCDLTRSHITKVRDGVASAKTATERKQTKPRGFSQVRGGEGVATRVIAGLSTVLGYAVEQGYLDRNPALGVHKVAEKRCERFLDPGEVQRLLATLKDFEAKSPKAVVILRLLLVTGCRYGEIAGLRWREVDLQRGLIVLAKSKTGARTVYLNKAAVTQLSEVKRVLGSDYVFPASRGAGSYKGTSKVWSCVRQRAGLDGVRIHDLRHTFASEALANGANLPEIAKLLGHAEVRTTARYAHLQERNVREASDRVARAMGLFPA